MGLVPPSLAPHTPGRKGQEQATGAREADKRDIGVSPFSAPFPQEWRRGCAAFGLMLALAGCAEAPAPALQAYDQAPVERRDIQVFVEAAGVVEPLRTVELKSKASGEILSINAENGDQVERSTLLVRIDKRIPTNNLAQAEAALKAAESRRSIAQSQMERAETLVRDNTITDSEYEETALALSESEAQRVRARVEVENARIALGDTDVLAPIDGTIIERNAEPGQVISSPTQDVGGGTLLLKMADLRRVLVRARVDETDIGKISAGMQANVSVAAYPGRDFGGQVDKIEPLAVVEQNVTLFSVLILLDNPDSLLLPGMNAEVEIKIAEELQAPAVPTAALRTLDDIAATADMLNWPRDDLLDAVVNQRATAGGGGSTRGAASAPAARDGGARRMPNASRRRPGPGRAPRRPPRDSNHGYDFRADYWVLVMRDLGPEPVWVRTGMSDFEYSVVLAGLQESEQVLLLPSTGLYQSQSTLRDWMRRRAGGLPGIG